MSHDGNNHRPGGPHTGIRARFAGPSVVPGRRSLTESIASPPVAPATPAPAVQKISGEDVHPSAVRDVVTPAAPRATLQQLFARHDAKGAAHAHTAGAAASATSEQVAEAASTDRQTPEQPETPAVQMRPSEGAHDVAEVHAAAARGTATPASPLPHGEVIRRSFGGHDISGIQAHTGPEAAASTRAMGAEAFATGDHVVFAGAPSLHTAAHEAAHVLQQRAGVQLKGGVGAVGDAYERHADQVAEAVVAGRSAEALLEEMPSGGQRGPAVQRSPSPAKVIELQGKAAEAKLIELGGRLVTDPDYADGHKAIAGSHVQYIVLGPSSPTVRLGVHQWTHDGPDGFHMQSITSVSRPDPIPSAAVGPNGLFVNAHNVGSTTIPLTKPGVYRTRAWVRAGVEDHGTFVGYELYVDHVIEVAHIARAIHEAEQKLPRHSDSFDKFHDTMAMQTALLRPGDPAAQNRDHAFGILTAAANPSPTARGPLGFTALDARGDRTKPATYHWYVSAQTKDKPPETLGGKPLVSVAGRRGYDFGTGTGIAMPAEHAGFWVVWYQAKDIAGHDIGEASYVQTVLGGAEMKSLEKHDQYMEHLGELAGKIQGEKLAVRGVHVSEANGNATQLRLFVGKKANDPSTVMLIDATPGIDPKSNRLEYSSASGPGVLDQFFQLNKYPKGRLRLNVEPNSFGIDTHMHEQETSGQGTFDRLSSNLSVGGMAALGVGILAAPVTRGQSLQVAMVVAGGLNAAAGAVSLYERLQHAEVSATGVALDVVAIASGLLNAGGAIRALTAGPGVLVANRATKFLLWTNFVVDSASALLIGAEGVQQIADIIDNDQLRPEQKREAVIRVVTNLIMAGALLAVAYGQPRVGGKATPEPVPHAGTSSHSSGLTTEDVHTHESSASSPQGPGAAHIHDEAFSDNRTFERSEKHSGRERSVGGKKVAKEPTDGQSALDFSFQISTNSPRRIGIDARNNEFVVFDRTGNKVADKKIVGGIFHGHVRSWDELETSMQKLLEERGLVKNGKIAIDSKKWVMP